MPLSYGTENPDSLEILLQKAFAIKTINQENITHIEARKGQKVVIKHQYSLRTKPASNKRQKTHHISENIDDMFHLMNNTSTKNVDDIIAAWAYHGEPLTKEKIAIDDFIDLQLAHFDDMGRLNDEYGILLEKYSRLLIDKEESRMAVIVVMRNMEVLQVAIGNIHEQLLDTADREEVSGAVTDLMKDFSKSLRSFHLKISGARLNIDFNGNIAEMETNIEVEGFKDCRGLACKYTLSDHEDTIWALQPYISNGEQYLASASRDSTIKLWDMRNNTLSATLTGHSADVSTLALYNCNGVQMLASASEDSTIRLWDLSSNVNAQILSNDDNLINALAVYEKGNEAMLISGNTNGTIKLWNLEKHTTIATLQEHEGAVYALSVYNYENKPYLVSGGFDKSIKVWSLNDLSLVATLDQDVGEVLSLLVIDDHGKYILVSGDNTGRIKLWSLNNHECIETIDAHPNAIEFLATVKCDGKLCLVSGFDNRKIKIWNLQNKSVVATLSNDAAIYSTKVFVNGDRACLACGDSNGNIKLWME